jgi:oligopeptide transport system permease protein
MVSAPSPRFDNGNRGSVGRYIIRRLLQFIPVFIGATLLIFTMVFALPGDPIRALAGERPMSPSVQQALTEQYNLDDPLAVQYVKYVGGVVQGDFGTDFRGREVSDIMKERIPRTVRLALVAFAFEIMIGIPAGVYAGIRQKGFMDTLVLFSTLVVISIPIFVLGRLAQLTFGLKLGWFPIAGIQDGFKSYLLPGMVLGSVSLAYVARLTRASVVENLRADYVRTAKAKGLKQRRVVGVHTLRNSLIPVVTYLGVDLGALLGGAIVTESIFNIPGLGNEVFSAIVRQEGTVVVGITTFLVIVYMVTTLAVDLLYAFLDPRIRYE